MEMSAGVAGAAGELPLPSFSVDVTRFWPPFFFWTAPNVDLGRFGRVSGFTHTYKIRTLIWDLDKLVQGDPSPRAKPPVDFKVKIRFGLACPGLSRPKRNFTFEVNGRFCTRRRVTL